jgi:hypothetical protein
MLIVENFFLSSIYSSGGYVTIPVPYLAYLSPDGICNIKGDIIKFTDLESPTLLTQPDFNEDYFYDSVRVDVILDCQDRILSTEGLVFLVGDTLYDIFGNALLVSEVLTSDVEIVDSGIYAVCDYCLLEFENNYRDYYNNINFSSPGILNYSEGLQGRAIEFKDTYLKSDVVSLTDDWTISFRFNTSDVSTDFKSIISFSNEGDNLFNILLQESQVKIYNIDEKKSFDFSPNEWCMIAVTSSGNVVYNGEIIDNIGSLDLSSGTFPFILGGDWNEDNTVNNLYDGLLENFRICKKELSSDEFESLYINNY